MHICHIVASRADSQTFSNSLLETIKRVAEKTHKVKQISIFLLGNTNKVRVSFAFTEESVHVHKRFRSACRSVLF